MEASVESHETIKFIAFTQDAKIISTGHKDGITFYKTSDLLENQVIQSETMKDSGLHNSVLIERLHSSALFFAVSEKDPRALNVYNVHNKNAITSLKFRKSILAVRAHKDRVVVCLEDSIHIYILNEMKLIHSIMDTPMNLRGVIDLTSNPEKAIIAYPGSPDTGSVHLFDAINYGSMNTFVAHEGALACLKFNQDGLMLATASVKGTVIRVYSVPSGSRLFEFRRGVSRCVTISSFCFSADGKYLASSSNTETVHVFKLEKEEAKTQETGEVSWFDTIHKTLAAYLPTQVMQVSELVTTERSFATARLPGAAKSNQVALINHNNHQHVMAATSEGFVYSYRLDPEGGELDLIKQNCIGPHSFQQTVPTIDDSMNFPPMNFRSM
ncbi:hypothetical protein B9Z55_016752 [Caenorhabditis nigoni]|uniref:WD repeat domain phosphoinositide-interacting protein 2 n=1 Tax=Caenorhabditis nigoni TaxID=1611254 RepID=A0A2G5T6W1_9PELO|nr:hypothetical protein B9Z55_016752 [Caenorhabditis nigoni]